MGSRARYIRQLEYDFTLLPGLPFSPRGRGLGLVVRGGGGRSVSDLFRPSTGSDRRPNLVGP